MVRPDGVSIPEGDIEIESGVNKTLVIDVDWEKKLIQWKRDGSRPTQRWQLNRTVEGFYTIRHSDGNVLAARGGWDLVIEPLESGNVAQQWSATPVKVYRIVNRKDVGSGEARALSATYEGTQGYPRVILYKDSDQPNQQWLLISSSPTVEPVSVPTGHINVQNIGVYRERVLDVDREENVVHWTKDEGRPTQQWQLATAAEEAFYRISHSDGRALAALGEWDLAIESPDPAKINQQWCVTPTVVYRVVNHQTGLDLSVNAERPYDGEKIAQYKYDRRPNQHWKLTKVS